MVILLVGTVAVLAIVARVQTGYWRTSTTLFSHALDLIESAWDIVIMIILLIIGISLIYAGFNLLDKLFPKDLNIDQTLELTALNIFSISERLSRDIRKFMYVSLVSAAILLAFGVIYLAIYVEDDPDNIFLYSGIIFFKAWRPILPTTSPKNKIFILI